MPYHIETWDKPGHEALRQQLRPKHLEFLARHAELLIACGAKLNDDGSDAGGGIYIVALEDRATAEGFINADPFTAGGLFRDVRITRWRKAYAGGRSYLPKP